MLTGTAAILNYPTIKNGLPFTLPIDYSESMEVVNLLLLQQHWHMEHDLDINRIFHYLDKKACLQQSFYPIYKYNQLIVSLDTNFNPLGENNSWPQAF